MFAIDPERVLERLAQLRARDAPTHGGRVLSYVYDSGNSELEALVERAAASVLHVNGLDPIVFGSIAVMERELGAFIAGVTHAPATAAATVTSGGTESIVLATLAARTMRPGKTTILAPQTRHPAWLKAAKLCGMTLRTVPVDENGQVDAARFASMLDDTVALAVVSAPSYPYGVMDPVHDIAASCSNADVDLHVDACVGGLVLPFVQHTVDWNFSLPGVTSISVDLHKYAYAPKGASVLIHRTKQRQAAQYFADTDWPGYPVVTSTLLGSRQSAGVAGAWAAVTALGEPGLRTLMTEAMDGAAQLRATIDDIAGLRIVGDPVGPLFAVASDTQSETPIDPAVVVDELRSLGFVAQAQPALEQADGPSLPATMHCTVMPALTRHIDECCAALRTAAERARASRATGQLGELAAAIRAGHEVPAEHIASLVENADAESLTSSSAELLALIEALPDDVVSKLMIQVLAAHLDGGTA